MTPMPDELSESLALSRLLGSLYTETFQRRPRDDNRPINVSSHGRDRREVILDESLKTKLFTAASMTYIYGPGGSSDEASISGDTAVRYSFTGRYA